MRRDRPDGIEDDEEWNREDGVAQCPQCISNRLFLWRPESGGDKDESWVVGALEHAEQEAHDEKTTIVRHGLRRI